MSRKIIQDIISKVVPSRQRNDSDEDEVFIGRRSSKKTAWTSLAAILAGAALVLGLFLFFSSAFSRVSLKISTTKKDIDMNEIVFLNKDGSGSAIKYDLMKFEDTASGKVRVAGTRSVSKTAAGIATIYNAYGGAAQRLVAGTRLETEDGRIYRTRKAVVVPGLSISGGKINPGAIDVAVLAAASGDRYNTPPTSFTIPGFKGSPKYQKFYAKSVKDISGGFSGRINVVLPADIQKARAALEESLRQKLLKSALLQAPDGYLLYEDAIFLSFKDNAIDNSSIVGPASTEAVLNVTGTLDAVIIKNDDLAKFIINKELPASGDQNITIADLDKLTLKILNKDRVDVTGGAGIPAQLTGKLSAVWGFDEKALKSRLLGIKKSDYQNVFKDFPAIEKAEVVFSPSWALYFPGDPSRIDILDLK